MKYEECDVLATSNAKPLVSKTELHPPAKLFMIMSRQWPISLSQALKPTA
jgi:hypothetical protein